MFAYCGNNPVNGIDETGEFSVNKSWWEYECGGDDDDDTGSYSIGGSRTGGSKYEECQNAKQCQTSAQPSLELPNPLAAIDYTEKVNTQQLQDDFHGFPNIVDNYGFLGKQTHSIGKDGYPYTKLQIFGSYKSHDGYFTYIWDSHNKCNHRFFEKID